MQFSLEVINKSMLAVDLIRKYKEDNGRPGTKLPSKADVEAVEKIIIECQESIQKDLIPEEDPKCKIRNQLSLKRIKNGQTMATINAQADEKALVSNPSLANMLFFSHWHNYENQASNILEMEKRYETHLKE